MKNPSVSKESLLRVPPHPPAPFPPFAPLGTCKVFLVQWTAIKRPINPESLTFHPIEALLFQDFEQDVTKTQAKSHQNSDKAPPKLDKISARFKQKFWHNSKKSRQILRKSW